MIQKCFEQLSKTANAFHFSVINIILFQFVPIGLTQLNENLSEQSVILSEQSESKDLRTFVSL